MKDSWRLFMGMSTQWLTGGMAGVRTGLNYAVLETVARSLKISLPLDTRIFSDIRLMEAEALSSWSRRRRG
jgi:hypothetical protein